MVRQYIPEEDRFDWESLVDPVPAQALRSGPAFDAWLRQHIEGDLAEAARGNVDSPHQGSV